MQVAIIGNRCPEKAEPDQHIAGQLFGPEQGRIEDVAAENLDRHQDGHGKTQTKEEVFDYPVNSSTGLVKKSEHAPAYRLEVSYTA